MRANKPISHPQLYAREFAPVKFDPAEFYETQSSYNAENQQEIAKTANENSLIALGLGVLSLVAGLIIYIKNK